MTPTAIPREANFSPELWADFFPVIDQRTAMRSSGSKRVPYSLQSCFSSSEVLIIDPIYLSLQQNRPNIYRYQMAQGHHTFRLFQGILLAVQIVCLRL